MFYRLSMPIECSEAFLRSASGSFFSPKRDLEDFETVSDFEVLMKTPHSHSSSNGPDRERDEFNNHKDHNQEKPSKLKQRSLYTHMHTNTDLKKSRSFTRWSVSKSYSNREKDVFDSGFGVNDDDGDKCLIKCFVCNSHVCLFRFMLKRTKPEMNSSNSSSNARLSEEVLSEERDDCENLKQTSTVRDRDALKSSEPHALQL